MLQHATHVCRNAAGHHTPMGGKGIRGKGAPDCRGYSGVLGVQAVPGIPCHVRANLPHPLGWYQTEVGGKTTRHTHAPVPRGSKSHAGVRSFATPPTSLATLHPDPARNLSAVLSSDHAGTEQRPIFRPFPARLRRAPLPGPGQDPQLRVGHRRRETEGSLAINSSVKSNPCGGMNLGGVLFLAVGGSHFFLSSLDLAQGRGFPSRDRITPAVNQRRALGLLPQTPLAGIARANRERQREHCRWWNPRHRLLDRLRGSGDGGSLGLCRMSRTGPPLAAQCKGGTPQGGGIGPIRRGSGPGQRAGRNIAKGAGAELQSVGTGPKTRHRQCRHLQDLRTGR